MNQFAKPTKNEQMAEALMKAAHDIRHACTRVCGYKDCDARAEPTDAKTALGWIMRCTNGHLSYRVGEEFHAELRLLRILRMEP